MCLVLKNKERKIAEEDIPCIKVIIKDGRKWMTPYLGIHVKPGQLAKSRLVLQQSSYSDTPIISIGLHSLVPEDTYTIDCELAWFKRRGYEVKAVNCIIPKGAAYYLGSFEYGNNNSYASDKLKYPKPL